MKNDAKRPFTITTEVSFEIDVKAFALNQRDAADIIAERLIERQDRIMEAVRKVMTE